MSRATTGLLDRLRPPLPSLVSDLDALRCRIRGTLHNPTNARIGALYPARRMVGRDMASYYPPQLQLLKLRYLAAERYPALGPLSDAAEVERHKQYEYWSERGKAKPQPRRTNKKRKR